MLVCFRFSKKEGEFFDMLKYCNQDFFSKLAYSNVFFLKILTFCI